MFRCGKCDGRINCPSLTPNDEANCTQCPLDRPLDFLFAYSEAKEVKRQHRCDCNKPGNFTCEGRGRTCYHESGKIFVYSFK